MLRRKRPARQLTVAYSGLQPTYYLVHKHYALLPPEGGFLYIREDDGTELALTTVGLAWVKLEDVGA